MFAERLLKIMKGFKNLDDLKHFYKNVLGKVCFAYDAAYFDSKYLPWRTITGYERYGFWNFYKS